MHIAKPEFVGEADNELRFAARELPDGMNCACGT